MSRAFEVERLATVLVALVLSSSAWAVDKPPLSLWNQAGLEQELVSLHDEFLIPPGAVQAEAYSEPLLAGAAGTWVRGESCPSLQARRDLPLDYGRFLGPVILPGEVVVPAPPLRLPGLRCLTHQAEIADRDHALARGIRPVAIGKRVELLDIAQRLTGLLLDACAKARLQRPMTGLENA